MSGDQPPYRPGDVVNGHMLGADGRWVPIATPPGPSIDDAGGSWGRTAAAGPVQGFAGMPTEQVPPEYVAPEVRYRPGDVVNGYVLNARYQWEPVETGSEDGGPKWRPPGALAVGAGVLGLVPVVGGLFAVLAMVLGARIVTVGGKDRSVDYLVGVVAIVLGAVTLVGRFFLT